ncbi:ATP-binding protein [Peribacillus kribbensis]|uniref:ATP-binding protein n=1 Tax=Peribacillus kribbensis TaxID=356658 RepID=UPI0005532698|nr:ATP-binding protein [Peribacillus kribbensis]
MSLFTVFFAFSKSKFKQCMLNMIKNSLEATASGGKLRVTSFCKSGYVQIKIMDTGIGMSPEQLKRLGEPYYSTKGGNGTGLGMMVVYS